MNILWAKQALTADGWAYGVRIALGPNGKITAITPNRPPEGQRLDLALPAIGNLHSHAFQRAMAGLGERRGNTDDSFWSWRSLMYGFLDLITPDDVQAISAYVQMEMLLAGYGAVAEFHYLHHGRDGSAYRNRAEMSERIWAARETSGIGLTHLPVCYAQGGCDGRELSGGQLRFSNDFNQFQAIVEANTGYLNTATPDCNLGVAPHSLRAVAPEILDDLAQIRPQGPVHIHIAEQPAEVAEVLAYLGARPVEWLLSIHPVDTRWCLIHATQMTAQETIALARSGAVAGLCPITESNLGDGIFDGVRYLSEHGRFGLGSDSNIRISLTEEFRTLEYSQRLRDNSRAALACPNGSTGRAMFEAAATGGAQALGRGRGVLAVGEWADIVEVSTDHVDLDGLAGDALLDAFLFARDDHQVRNVWSAGRHLVRDGIHIRQDAITGKYRQCVKRLRAGL